MPPRRKKTATQDEIRWYQGRVVLDWSSGHGTVLRHERDCKFCGTWNDTVSPRRPRPDPCPRCGCTAHLLDNGQPWHKTCLEEELTERHQRGAL